MKFLWLLVVWSAVALCTTTPSPLSLKRFKFTLQYILSLPSNREVFTNAPHVPTYLKDIMKSKDEPSHDNFENSLIMLSKCRLLAILDDVFPTALSPKVSVDNVYIFLLLSYLQPGNADKWREIDKWPNALEFSGFAALPIDGNFYATIDENVTSSITKEYLSEEFMKTVNGKQITYRLCALLFETESNEFIRFELQKQGDEFVLVNKSELEEHKLWNIEDLASSDLLPASGNFHLYYVRIELVEFLYSSYQYGMEIPSIEEDAVFDDSNVASFSIQKKNIKDENDENMKDENGENMKEENDENIKDENDLHDQKSNQKGKKSFSSDKSHAECFLFSPLILLLINLFN